MAPGVGRGHLDQKHFERQMGCMAGFLHLFDRHQILARKRLPAPRAAVSSSAPERSDASSVASFANESHHKDGARSSPKHRESSRLSLDTCAVVDAKGKLRAREIRAAPPIASPGEQSDGSEAAAEECERQRRCPSVVARLMGLDALPDDIAAGGGESAMAELRRSASESRVPRYPSYYRFLDGGTFPKPSPVETAPVFDEVIRMSNLGEFRVPDAKKTKSPARTPLPAPLQRKSSFDAEDFFPEPKRWGLLPIDVGKRRLMRGMDEAARDLETLKQILEALQLKGLLHSKPSDHQINGRLDRLHTHRSRFPDDSQIVVIEPSTTPARRPLSDPRPPFPPRSGAGRRNPAVEAATPPVRRNQRVDQSPAEGNERKNRAPSSPAKQRTSNATDSGKSPPPRRRTSAVNPPKTPPNRVGPTAISQRQPPNRRPKQEVTPKRRISSLAEDDTSAAAAAAPLDFERSWEEEYRSGRQLLERCDRLLHSIAAFTAAEQVAAVSEKVVAATAEQQPSPVSVLDPPVLGEESSPRSPVSKRSFDFKGDQLAECEEDATASNSGDGPEGQEQEENNDDDDYTYVTEILRASDRHGDATDVYALIEKRRGAVSDVSNSKSAPLHRRLVFDVVTEILDRKRCASPPPWESFVRPGSLSVAARGAAALLLPEVWEELRRAGEQMSADDVNVLTCQAVRRDLLREDLDGWARPAAEVADAVIQIERQIFKDLIAGAIRDLADAKPRAVPRRKLVF